VNTHDVAADLIAGLLGGRAELGAACGAVSVNNSTVIMNMPCQRPMQSVEEWKWLCENQLGFRDLA
jgi:hypothetical protein